MFKVLAAPHPILSKKATPLEAVSGEVQDTLNKLLETMYAFDGIGLAAPQVGISQRMFVVDLQDKVTPVYRIINPVITWASKEDSELDEGCLSVPNHYAKVVRPASVEVAYLNEQGQPQKLKASGLLSHVLQHEIDHLDGILFLDHLSALKKNMILRKLLKKR